MKKNDGSEMKMKKKKYCHESTHLHPYIRNTIILSHANCSHLFCYFQKYHLGGCSVAKGPCNYWLESFWMKINIWELTTITQSASKMAWENGLTV
jgi:hypothetical protein